MKLALYIKSARRFAAAVGLAAASLALAQTPSVTTDAGEDWTFPASANVTAEPYSGFFKTANNTANPGGFIKHLKVDDLNWKALNPTDPSDSTGKSGVYDFSDLDDLLTAAYNTQTGKANYVIIMRLECGQYSGWDGRHIPDWVVAKYGIGSGSPTHTFRSRETTSAGPEIIYAAPWHTGVQTQFKNFIEALCAHQVNGYRFIEHPALGAVFLHGCSRSRGEESSISGAGWEGTGGRDAANASAAVYGYADCGAAQKAALLARIGYWHDTLAAQQELGYMYKVTYVGSGAWDGTSLTSSVGDEIEQAARDAGMGGRGGFMEHYFYGRLHPGKAGQTYSNGYVVSDWGDPLRDGRFWSDEIEENPIFKNPLTGANIYYYKSGSTVEPGDPGPVRDLVSRTLFFRGAQVGMNFLWASPWAIRYACWNNPDGNTTDCTPIINGNVNTDLADDACADSTNKARMPLWYTLVAGKGPDRSPDAACWLREATVRLIPGEDPAGAPWKNMERMLMQRDIAGAMSQPAELLNMPRVDLKPNSEYQEYMARRTNVGATPTAQRSIAFKLDPDFRASLGNQAVQIKVTYKNSSGTTWKLRVARGSGTPLDLGTVTNGTNGQWRTATFTLASANAPFQPGTSGSAVGDGMDFDINAPSGTTNNVTVRYVRVIRTQPVATGGSGLVGQWKLDETSGTTAADSSGNGNNGTLTNFAATPPWASGGLDFDGTDDLINAGSGTSLDNLPALTASAWIYPDTMGETSNGRVICKGGAAGTFTGWRLIVQNTNRVAFSVDYQTGYLSRTTADNVLTPGAWNHVAVTWDGSGTAANAKIYINGTEVSSYSATTNAPTGETRANDASSNLIIGNDSSGAKTFDGILRDVRVYNTVLSATAIGDLAEAAPLITTSTLPSGRTTVSYSQSLSASGGATPYAWSVSAGALPAGLTLSSAGAISGSPTTAGSSNFTARVTDANGSFDDQPLAITIATNSVPSITTATLPAGTVGAAYSQNVASTGGDIAWTWSVASGALPAGLTLSNVNSQTATISGTPTTAGTANFTLQLADVDNDTDTQALSIAVTDPLPAAPSGLGLTVSSYNQINLAWTDNSSNETGFRIERKTGSGGTYAEIGTAGAGVATYNDTTCGAGTTYYYRVRAYNGAGNSAYCTEVNATSSEITSGRQGHWKLDEGTGTTTSDASGNGNTGTLTSGPVWVTGKLGNGLSFDGTNDLVDCGSGTSLDNLSALTVSAWFKADTLGETSNGRILSKGGAAGTFTGWRLLIQNTNRIAFSVDYGSNYMSQVTADNVIATGAWYHVIVTWNGGASPSSTHIYVNGVEVSYGTGNTGTGTRANDGTYNLTIGNDSSAAKTFDGTIDEVRVYNRVLSSAELTAVYRAGL